MTGHSVLVLRALGVAMFVCGTVGLVAYASDDQHALAIASALGGISCWATFTTAADFVEHALAKLESINKNAKRMADALEQGLR